MMSVRSMAVGALVLAFLLSGCDALISPQHRLERARAQLDAGEWGRAAIELRKLLQADPRNAEARLLLARWSLDVGRASDAQDALERAMAAGATGRELDQLRVRMWLALNEPKAVLDSYARQKLDLPGPDRSIAIARAYNELRQPDRALATLQPLLASQVAPTDARLTAAEAFAQEGRTDLALRQVDVAMAADHISWSAPLLRGRLVERSGRFIAAEDDFGLAIQRMRASTPLPQRVEALAALTEVRLDQNELNEASQSEASLGKLAPDAPITQMLGGRLSLARGDYVNGIADLERLVAHAPHYVQARILLAAAQLRRGDLEQAQDNLEQVVQETPNDVLARKLLAQVRLKLSEPEDALQALIPTFGVQAMDPELYALLGEVESRVGNPNSVLEALERSLRAHPDNRTLQLSLAEAFLSVNRPGDALELLETTDDHVEGLRRDTLLVSAVTAVRGPLAAGAEVDMLLAAHPHDSGVLNLAASFFLSQRQFDRARAILLQALTANPQDVTSLITLARVEYATGGTAAATSALRRALDADQSNLAVRIALADLLTREKAFADAQQLLEASKTSGVPDLQFALARVALARGDTKQARAALDRAVALRPGSAELENRAGVVLFSARQYDSALARFRTATERVPDNAAYWFNAAQAQMALNRPAEARQSLEKANELQPEWVPAARGLCMLDLGAKNYASALNRARQLLTKQPVDPRALVLEGDVQEALGRFDEAVGAYSAAERRRPEAALVVKLFQAQNRAKLPKPEEPLQRWLAEHPNDSMVRTVLGNYDITRGELTQAARQFETVVEQTPNDAVALNNLAWTYGQLQDARAEAIAERAYTLAPSSPNVDDTLGWILARKHATGRALVLIGQAVKSDSEDPEMQYHYAYVLAEVGKRTEARTILSKVLAGKQDFDSRRDAQRLLAGAWLSGSEE